MLVNIPDSDWRVPEQEVPVVDRQRILLERGAQVSTYEAQIMTERQGGLGLQWRPLCAGWAAQAFAFAQDVIELALAPSVR